MAIDPETGLEIGIDPETGLPMTVGTGHIVSPDEAGSDQVSEAGTKGDPLYDADVLDFDGIPDAPGMAPRMEGAPDSEIEMPVENARGPGFVPGNVGVSHGSSASFTGITERGAKQSDRFFGPAKQSANDINAKLGEQFQNDTATMAGIMDRRRQAFEEMGKLDQEHADELMGIRRAQMDFHLKEMQLEEMAYSKAMQGAQQYLASYQQEMAGVRQMTMQTGNPMQGFTAPEGFAAGAALFAQGFLGARYGINVNVSGQLDRWVDQEMRAHQQQIQNRTQVAESNLTMYNLARQGANDDVLARQRLRGFMVDALKSKIYMEAARYKSATAMADAHAKAAELDGIQLKNMMEMRDKLMTQQLAILGEQRQWAKEQANASIESYKAAIDDKYKMGMLKVAQTEENRKGKEVKPGENPNLRMVEDPGRPIYDDKGNITGYEFGWALPEGMSDSMFKEVKGEIAKKNAAYRRILNGFNRIRELKALYPGLNENTFGIGKTLDPKYRQYQQEFNNSIMQLRHDIAGAQLTGFEQKEWIDKSGIDQPLQFGSNDFAINSLEQSVRDSFTTEVESRGGIALNQEGAGVPTNTKLSTTEARSQADRAPERQLSPVELAEGQSQDVNSKVPVQEGGSTLYNMYRSAGGERFGGAQEDSPSGFSGAMSESFNPGVQRSGDQQVDRLVKLGADAAMKGDQKTLTAARLALTRLGEKSGYAKFGLEMLDSQPEAVSIMME